MRKVQTYKVAVVDNFALLDAMCSWEAEKKKERGREKSYWKKGCEITHSTTHRLNILSILKNYSLILCMHNRHAWHVCIINTHYMNLQYADMVCIFSHGHYLCTYVHTCVSYSTCWDCLQAQYWSTEIWPLHLVLHFLTSIFLVISRSTQVHQ